MQNYGKHSLKSKNNNINKEFEIEKIGKKGLFLQDMIKAKVLVPPAFIISSVFENFMKETNLFSKIKSIIDSSAPSLNDSSSIIQVSSEINNIINQTKFPSVIEKSILDEFDKLKTDFVAVRHSFTTTNNINFFLKKEFASKLNVDRFGLIEVIKKFWTSFFSAPSIVYHFENNIDLIRPLSVLLIQKMINANVSGFSFSANPLINDNNQILIEARYGLSDFLLSSHVGKDTYFVNESNFNILGITILSQKKMLTNGKHGIEEVEIASLTQDQQKLSESQILVLSKITKHIENFYNGVPQKLEWVLDGNKFYILNSQPITLIK